MEDLVHQFDTSERLLMALAALIVLLLALYVAKRPNSGTGFSLVAAGLCVMTIAAGLAWVDARITHLQLLLGSVGLILAIVGALLPAPKAELPTGSFYLHKNGAVEGPFTAAQLRSMWHAGAIHAEMQFCKVGTEDWQPLSTLASTLEG